MNRAFTILWAGYLLGCFSVLTGPGFLCIERSGGLHMAASEGSHCDSHEEPHGKLPGFTTESHEDHCIDLPLPDTSLLSDAVERNGMEPSALSALIPAPGSDPGYTWVGIQQERSTDGLSRTDLDVSTRLVV
jgi:hypothetical protein